MTRNLRLAVDNPPLIDLLDDVERGQGVAFAKRTHGVWDHLALLATGAWQAEDWMRCDRMIFKGEIPSEPNLSEERDDYMRYLGDLLADVVTPPDDPRWKQSISLDLDYLTAKLTRRRLSIRVGADPRLLEYWDWRYSYEDVIDRYHLVDRPWTFAQVFTEGIVSQSILELPVIARSRHVILVAPSKMHDLAARWNLDPKHFEHVPAPRWPDSRPRGSLFTDPILPALRSFRVRESFLERLRLVRSDRPLLFLFELGTCAQWLIRRLFDERPGDTYLDMGRALELWFPDTPWPLKRPVKSAYLRASRAFYGDKQFDRLRRGGS